MAYIRAVDATGTNCVLSVIGRYSFGIGVAQVNASTSTPRPTALNAAGETGVSSEARAGTPPMASQI